MTCPRPAHACSWTALGDLVQDLTSSRPHRWGFAFGDDLSSLSLLEPFELPGRHSDSLTDTMWACPGAAPKPFPHYSRFLLHPCAGSGTSCCGLPKAAAHAIYKSWFQLPDILMLLSYEVMPACGDGLTVQGTRLCAMARARAADPSSPTRSRVR